MSNSRKKRTEKAKPDCKEIEENRRREGGMEVRRLHIVYFLSRNGKIEQPHLIRVHHISNNGVFLRDVKRWMWDIRGREMLESFSWSYKRNYKTGHIWQDLTDNDLLTPFSDNEYILKGSLISSPQIKDVELFHPFNERNISTTKQDKKEDEYEDKKEAYEIEPNISPNPPPPEYEKSPSSSSRSSEENTIRNKVVLNSSRTEDMKEGEKEKICNEVVIKRSLSHVKSKSSRKGRGETHRPRGRAVNVLRNLLRCRLVDTKDSVNGKISKKNYQTSDSRNERKNWERNGSNGGSRKMTEKTTSAMFKPSKDPNCSQCGKPFKPEKLHSHMKSCKSLKERGRTSSFNKKEQNGTRRPSKVIVTVL